MHFIKISLYIYDKSFDQESMFTRKLPFALLGACMLYIVTAKAQQDTTLESALELSIEQLMNTKVSIATKSEQKISEAPAIVTVITEEVIKNSGARNLTDILKDVPGFEFAKSRTGIVNIGVRGVKDILTTARFLVLKDGVPFNDAMYSSGLSMTKQFDINSIERIEVIRGPGSALYGRNAFIGVVNIITKIGKNKNEVDLYSSIGNFNTIQLGGSYSTAVNDFNTYLSFNKTESDLTNSKFADGFGGESLWNIGYDNINLNSTINYKNLMFSGSYYNLVNKASTGPFMTESDKSTKIGIYSLSYSDYFSDKMDFQVRLYGRNENQVQNLEIYKPDLPVEIASGVTIGDIYPEGAYVTPKFKSYIYGTDLNLRYNFNTRHQTLIGIQADFYGITNAELYSSYDTYTNAPLTYIENGDTLYRGKETQLKEERGWIDGNGHDYINAAFYFQHMYSPINNLTFTFGGRYDIDSEFGSIFNPRLAMVWSTNQKLFFKLLYGQAYRAPNTQEQYKLTGFTIGNKDLKPETIKTTELSVDYNFSSKINNRITFFYNILDKMIFAQGITSGNPGSPYDNIGKNTSKGFEYEFKMILSGSFYMFTNYSFTSSQDKVSSKDDVEQYSHRDIAPHKINFGANYRFLKYFNLNLGINYRSEREKYFAINKRTGDYILDDLGNKTFLSTQDIGNYYLVNSKIRIIELVKGLEIAAEFYNLLDKQYYDQDNEYANQPLREGRHIIFKAKYSF